MPNDRIKSISSFLVQRKEVISNGCFCVFWSADLKLYIWCTLRWMFFKLAYTGWEPLEYCSVSQILAIRPIFYQYMVWYFCGSTTIEGYLGTVLLKIHGLPCERDHPWIQSRWCPCNTGSPRRRSSHTLLWLPCMKITKIFVKCNIEELSDLRS